MVCPRVCSDSRRIYSFLSFFIFQCYNVPLEVAKPGARSFKENSLENTKLDELNKLLRSLPEFKSCAYYLAELGEVIVARKDCSYTAQRITQWSDLHWENHRPWYARWEKCIGFKVWCPPAFGLIGEVLVTTVLDRIAQRDSNAFGEHRARFYRLAKGLTVRICK